MQTARGLVVVAIELATGMQYGKYSFESRLLGLCMFVDRDAATIIVDGDRRPVFM